MSKIVQLDDVSTYKNTIYSKLFLDIKKGFTSQIIQVALRYNPSISLSWAGAETHISTVFNETKCNNATQKNIVLGGCD